MATLRTHAMRFPGETPKYRAARNRLPTAERDLRRRVVKVAAMRRKLPLGWRVPNDYVFEEGARDFADTNSVHPTRLSESSFETDWTPWWFIALCSGRT